jgi:hypothetical protein
MKLHLRNTRLALLLAAVFVVTFLIVFLVVSNTQSAYSTPPIRDVPTYGQPIYAAPPEIYVGPPPNSINVSLDSTIVVNLVHDDYMIVQNVRLTPEIPIAARTDEVDSRFGDSTTIFYVAGLLKPSTTYNVSATIHDDPYSWTFTTTNEFHPSVGYYFATYVWWVAVTSAIIATSIIGLILWHRRKSRYLITGEAKKPDLQSNSRANTRLAGINQFGNMLARVGHLRCNG